MKKYIALLLALVLAISIFTPVSTASVATNLTDWNSVQHKDAVSLTAELGIIKGKPDGSFDPSGNIDRASWAKMVYIAACGNDDADGYIGGTVGLKDIVGNWAEGYIVYLKANNYISGDSNGYYNPSSNVTVVAACKTMLTVLGYDADDRGYQNNAAWVDNIMNDAISNGILKDVDSEQTAMVPLSRDNAAQIVANALNAHMVKKDAGSYIELSHTLKDTIYVPVQTVTLDKTSLNLEVGDTAILTATITPANATDKEVRWYSSSKTVATVDNGKITALAPGVASITAVHGATTTNPKIVECMLTVTAGRHSPCYPGTAVPDFGAIMGLKKPYYKNAEGDLYVYLMSAVDAAGHEDDWHLLYGDALKKAGYSYSQDLSKIFSEKDEHHNYFVFDHYAEDKLVTIDMTIFNNNACYIIQFVDMNDLD